MKRFYKTAEPGTAPGGHVVRLDGKVVKTPLLHPLIVPTAKLAEAMAKEWAAQGAEIIPASMPLTQLASTMLDKAKGHDRRDMERTLAEYGGSDMLCYFATHPQDLVARQKALWLPLLAWLEAEHGIRLETVSGIQYHNQSKEALQKIGAVLGALSPEDFTAVQVAAGVTGSLVIGLALGHGVIAAKAAWEAACVDEVYQLEKWGADALAQRRLDNIRAELDAVEQFRALIQP